MKKILLALAILAGASFQTFSQSGLARVIEENTDIFHGKWVAEQGNKKYEMFLKREMMKIPGGNASAPEYRETIWGEIIYFENGKVIRQTADNGYEAIVSFIQCNHPFQIFFGFLDKELHIDRYFNFTINAQDHNKALLQFEEEMRHQKRKGWNETEPDIPDGVTWTKVE